MISPLWASMRIGCASGHLGTWLGVRIRVRVEARARTRAKVWARQVQVQGVGAGARAGGRAHGVCGAHGVGREAAVVDGKVGEVGRVLKVLVEGAEHGTLRHALVRVRGSVRVGVGVGVRVGMCNMLDGARDTCFTNLLTY